MPRVQNIRFLTEEVVLDGTVDSDIIQFYYLRLFDGAIGSSGYHSSSRTREIKQILKQHEEVVQP